VVRVIQSDTVSLSVAKILSSYVSVIESDGLMRKFCVWYPGFLPAEGVAGWASAVSGPSPGSIAKPTGEATRTAVRKQILKRGRGLSKVLPFLEHSYASSDFSSAFMTGWIDSISVSAVWTQACPAASHKMQLTWVALHQAINKLA
jgi:hypothetical protein